MSVTVLYIFCFAYSKLSVIDELCVRRFHHILLNIDADRGIVEVMDSKNGPLHEWANMQAMLQKYFQILLHYIGNFRLFPDIK